MTKPSYLVFRPADVSSDFAPDDHLVMRVPRTAKYAPNPPAYRAGRKPLWMPWSYIHALNANGGRAEQAYAEHGVVSTTTAALRRRRADDPLPEKTAIMPRDERAARTGKPLALITRVEGDSSRAIRITVGAGQYHMEELIERDAEARHYREDGAPDRDKPDIRQEWFEEASRREAYKKGRFSSAPGQTHGVLDATGRPDFWVNLQQKSRGA